MESETRCCALRTSATMNSCGIKIFRRGSRWCVFFSSFRHFKKKKVCILLASIKVIGSLPGILLCGLFEWHCIREVNSWWNEWLYLRLVRRTCKPGNLSSIKEPALTCQNVWRRFIALCWCTNLLIGTVSLLYWTWDKKSFSLQMTASFKWIWIESSQYNYQRNVHMDS